MFIQAGVEKECIVPVLLLDINEIFSLDVCMHDSFGAFYYPANPGEDGQGLGWGGEGIQGCRDRAKGAPLLQTGGQVATEASLSMA